MKRFARARPWALLFGPWSLGVSLVVVTGALAGALWLGPDRIGVDLCWFRNLSGLPCPGCGLTRSVVALVRGEVLEAIAFHPFGILVAAWALVASSSMLWPRGLRRTVEARLERSEASFDRAYRWLVAGFIGFGVLRVGWTLVESWRLAGV